MVKVLYADWDKFGRHGVFDLQMGSVKIDKETISKKYVQVAKFDDSTLSNYGIHEKDDLSRLMKLWELFNTRAHEWKVRSMCVGDIIQIGRTKYIVARFGFDKLEL